MKEIQLTQEQVALVDDEDFEWLNQWKWYAHKDRNTFYAARAGGRGNAQNRPRVAKTSQYMGVYWNKQAKKWRSKIYINGKNKHLGTFIDELQAFLAYKQAVEFLGESVVDIIHNTAIQQRSIL